MNTERRPVSLAGAELHRHCHACAFFNSQDEEYRLLVPFAKEGYDRGEHVFHVADAAQRQERLRRMEEAGIDLATAGSSGQVKVPVWEEVYLRGGKFDQDDMLALVENVFKQAKSDGFGMTRLWANMEWSLLQQPGAEQLVEYESRLNQLVSRYDDVVVCTYDLNRFSAPVVMDILRTHPLVIIGGLLHENPFFVPPDEFLRELRQRKASAPAN